MTVSSGSLRTRPGSLGALRGGAGQISSFQPCPACSGCRRCHRDQGRLSRSGTSRPRVAAVPSSVLGFAQGQMTSFFFFLNMWNFIFSWKKPQPLKNKHKVCVKNTQHNGIFFFFTKLTVTFLNEGFLLSFCSSPLNLQ